MTEEKVALDAKNLREAITALAVAHATKRLERSRAGRFARETFSLALYWKQANEVMKIELVLKSDSRILDAFMGSVYERITRSDVKELKLPLLEPEYLEESAWYYTEKDPLTWAATLNDADLSKLIGWANVKSRIKTE